MLDLKQLKANANGLSILHAEDNPALRENASKLFAKFFDTVYTASDGEEGFEVFQKNNPDIVITDIKMPHMSGVELAKKIRKISPHTKIIIMSAFDDKEYLYTAIELGVFRFLKKPVNLQELTQILYDAVAEIKHERNISIFNSQLENVFNAQSSMIMMLKNSTPILANQMFLDFFDLKEIEEFESKYKDFGNLLLKHEDFLYNKPEKSWLEELTANPQQLHHVQLKSRDGTLKHFLLKYQPIPQKDAYAVLSFDDVSELALSELFDKDSADGEVVQNHDALIKLLEVIQRNNAKVQLHNYYKGLSIVNDAAIVSISNDKLTIKTNYLQQKAVQFEQKSFIVSETLPHAIACDVVSMSFEKQVIEFQNLRFVATSPTLRKTVRLVPEEQHTASLFLGEEKFQGETKIADISLDAVNLELKTLPAGLQEKSVVTLELELTIDKEPFNIKAKGLVLQKIENEHNFNVIFELKFIEGGKKELVKYITHRQMSLIREFKGLQNG